jgi:alpha,alpha-trehalase
MTDCHSLVDIKITANPVLYLPAEISPPADVTALEGRCHVQVKTLPRQIGKIGDVSPEELHAAGLLYLPNPYVVPGGRFNEMYGWDSYFILLGLEADHREALAKGMVDNFLFEIEHYGAVLNANRTYYLTRSQPPFLTSMIRAVYENPASFPATPAGRSEARAWLGHAYTLAKRTTPPGRAPSTKPAQPAWRATSITEPAPSRRWPTTALLPDVIRWLVAHPHSRRRRLSGEGLRTSRMQPRRRDSSRPVAMCG